MKVLILGGSGFIGTNLIRYLKAKDPSIEIVSTTRHLSTTAAKSSRHIVCDTSNIHHINRIIRYHDAVINLAGISGSVETMKAPQKTIRTNTIGQLNVLESCRRHNPSARIVFASSRLEYGPPQQLPVTHEHVFNPATIYGISKYTATKYTQLYHSMHSLNTVVLRMSNPFGYYVQPTVSGQSPKATYNIVNYFYSLASADKEIPLYGDGSQQRDYIYIDDICEAIYKSITQKQAVGTVLNIGSGHPYSLKKLVSSIIQTVGKGRIVYKPWPSLWKKLETGDFFFDIGMAKQILDWEPSTSVEDGIRQLHAMSTATH